MKNIGRIAAREFTAAVMNKGFIIGALILPVLIVGAVMLFSSRAQSAAETLRGEIRVIDRTGALAADVRAALTPDAIAARREAANRRALQGVPAAVGAIAAQQTQSQQTQQPQQAQPAQAAVAAEATARGSATTDITQTLHVIDRPADADLAREQAWLLEPAPATPHLALVVLHPAALAPDADHPSKNAAGEIAGAYDVYVPAYARQRSSQVLRDALRDAIVDVRLRTRQLDRTAIDQLTLVTPGRALTVTHEGTRPTHARFELLLPVLLVTLLSMGIVLGGQTLLASTVEEKSNRLMEVLLSAVSPFELMAGKLLGHLGVTLCVLAVQIGLGLLALASFAMLGLVDASLLGYFVVFLLVSYLMYGAVMSAIGASVTDISEAQALVGPIMVLILLGAMLVPNITRDPTSTLSVVLSYVPPVNTLAMMGRLASASPPAAWEVWLTVAISLAASLGTTWVAAKIFKVGLLMHGKPPDFATLVRWVRTA